MWQLVDTELCYCKKKHCIDERYKCCVDPKSSETNQKEKSPHDGQRIERLREKERLRNRNISLCEISIFTQNYLSFQVDMIWFIKKKNSSKNRSYIDKRASEKLFSPKNRQTFFLFSFRILCLIINSYRKIPFDRQKKFTFSLYSQPKKKKI